MRPTCNFGRFSFLSSPSNPGLLKSWSLVYNEWQILPVREKTRSVHGSFFPDTEAAMKPAGQNAKTDLSSATEQSQDRPSVETRAQRLERIKREIASGTYETEEKLERAIERMLGVLVDRA
ncbi:flagellar biosynthesis anti-sigma factor FlgM [Planctomicrobium sp. SH668]|uniref:flagellar biosynthesis anti-sigma factor FlgM n=1 Tax=Planctomicrobium sp. SH668 TaxID=3448126 RepID=UPI003F5B5400